MSLRLKEITYQVRCTVPGCAFNVDIIVKENIMGATEADVDSEAFKIAKNQAYIKHDSLYGRRHPLSSPDIHKISSRYERFGPVFTDAVSAPMAPRPSNSVTKIYAKGDKIIRRGESATTVCEVIRGSAYNEKRPEKTYRTGATFGAAALFEQAQRLADIVAGEDNTTIAFFNMRQLSKTDPVKARELYNAAMEDFFEIVTYLEQHAASLEKQVERLKASAKPAKKQVKTAAKKPAKKAAKAVKAKKIKKAKKPAARSQKAKSRKK
jgi:exonuclease VII small subunit